MDLSPAYGMVCVFSPRTVNGGVIVNDFLMTKREEIAARLRELGPVVEEYRQLEAAVSALAAIPATTTPSPPRSPARGAGSRSRSARARARATSGGRGRPRGSGTRALQTLEIVRASPGITIAEIAAAVGIKQNYLYRVLPGLQKDGKIVKRDRGWHATDSAPSPKVSVPS
jgi:CRP-like cAMP-binding protein